MLIKAFYLLIALLFITVTPGQNRQEESAGDAQRIVFVFGSDHIPQIRTQLQSLGFEPQIPARMFVPGGNNKVPDAVLKRWRRNLENLRLILDRKIPVTDDYYQKIINSRRIQDLEQALQKSS
jgi:hypothetical protein